MIMKYISYVLLSLVTLLVQITLLRYIAINTITPDLLLLLIIYIALREGQIAGLLFGFAVGFTEDLCTSSVLGLSALSKVLVGYIAGLFYGVKSGLDIRFLGIILLVCSFLQECFLSLVASFGIAQGFWSTLWHDGLPRLLYSGAVGFIIFAILPKKTWKESQPEWFLES